MNRFVLVGLGVVLAIGLGLYLAWPTVFPPSSLDLPYRSGYDAPYAYGSCSSATFSLYRPAVLTGAFSTNESVTFYVVSGEQNFGGGAGCFSPGQYAFSTGSTTGGALNVPLAAGTYTAVFFFDNRTGTQTMLSITQSFVAQFRPVTQSPGQYCVSISCFTNNRGPAGPDGTY